MGLILHCGAERVERDALRNVATPDPTSSWRPVPHYDVAELVAGTAQARGYSILKEEYGLTPDGRKMFGVLRFAAVGNPEYIRALGIRNSHDKRFALGLVAGCAICVCDNLLFQSSETVIHRKHTSGIEIGGLVDRAFDGLGGRYERLDGDIGRLKETGIGHDAARLEVVDAAERGAIPSQDILPVLREFMEPRHAEFALPTRWSLYNAFTEVAKKYSPARADKCYRTLALQFGLG